MPQTKSQSGQSKNKTYRASFSPKGSPSASGAPAHLKAKYEAWGKKALEATKYAVTMWRLRAHFKGIKIMGPTAIGGMVTGPSLQALIAEKLPKNAAWEKDFTKAYSEGVGKQWHRFQRSIKVPGLPWYPTFAAYPGPMAPPMPNVPSPLVACIGDMSAMGIDGLTGAVVTSDVEKHPGGKELLESTAAIVGTAFLIWATSQMIQLVAGKGPVPSYAPPAVMSGPVVNGDVIPAPGHFAS